MATEGTTGVRAGELVDMTVAGMRIFGIVLWVNRPWGSDEGQAVCDWYLTEERRGQVFQQGVPISAIATPAATPEKAGGGS
jgi:hypothetical protein